MTLRLAASLRRHMVRGLIVVVPLGITAYVLQFCYDLTAGYLAPLVRTSTGHIPEAALMAVSVVLFLGLLFMLGILGTAAAGRRLIAVLEFVLRRIPLVRSVYGGSKQIVEVLGPKDDENNYEAAVLVDFPFPGVKSLSFVTGRTVLGGKEDYLRVFVPTTPNPTSGYLELYPVKSVEASGMSVEDAVKAAMSAGLLMPDVLQNTSLAEGEYRALAARAGDKTVKEREKTSYWARNKAVIRNRLLSGLLLLVPIAITAVVVRFVFDLTAGKVTPFTRRFFEDMPHSAVMALSMVIFVIGLWAVGTIATAVLGQRLISLGERLIEKIPMVRAIYGASKQIVGTLAMQSEEPGSGLEAPVLVEFPYPGVRALGFLVGRVRQADGTELCKVFMPTSPNISVGLFLMYRTEDVFLCGLSVDEAIRMIVSLGILGPKAMPLTPVSAWHPDTSAGEVEGQA